MTFRTLSCISVALLLVVAPGIDANPAAAQQAQAVVIDTFDNPVYVASPPDEAHLLFVVEQPGRIRVLDDEVTETDAFLDIADMVNFGGEQGLLSMAFAPDYAMSRRFYVAFNNVNGDVEIAEFKRTSGNPKLAARSSMRKLLVVRHRGASNHNGGQLQFGPEGLLYISIGDGGALSPPGEPARNLKDLRGKILRIDPLPSGNKPYGIPPDNPFVGTGNKPEIYSYGFRNPWRFAFEGGRIIIADVGETKHEEVNYLSVKKAAGGNFGWPQYEGDSFFDKSRPGEGPPIFPMLTYSHAQGRCAIIGGYVSHDPLIPNLKGRYLYGDLCSGKLRSFIAEVAGQQAKDDKAVGVVASGLTSFGRGPQNKLYITQQSGELSRIAPPGP